MQADDRSGHRPGCMCFRGSSVLKGGQQGSGQSLEPVNKIPKTCVLWQQADEIDVTTNVPCTIIRNPLPALGQSSLALLLWLGAAVEGGNSGVLPIVGTWNVPWMARITLPWTLHS